MNPILGGLIILGLLCVFYLFWHVTAPAQTQQAIQRIQTDTAPYTGDQIQFFINSKPLSSLSQQLSTTPIVPQQFKDYLSTTLAGTDSHGNLLIKNNTQIINSSTLAPATTAYLQANPQVFANMQNITTSGVGYSSASAGTGSLVGQTTDSITAGQIMHLQGKLTLYDKSRCSLVTQNGQTTTQCPTIVGPYKFTVQILCVDTDAFRCSYLSDRLPTSHQETNPDGTFYYPFTTLQDKYYVGNYDAHFWVESETIVNGQTVTDEYDHPFTVLQW